MPRPSKEVIKTTQVEQRRLDVLEVPVTYVVTCGDTVISTRWSSLPDSNGETRVLRYTDNIYPTKGHAQRAADKLNQYFSCSDFVVRVIQVCK